MVRIAALVSILVLCASVTPADGAVRKRSKKAKVAHEAPPKEREAEEEPVDEAFEEMRDAIAPDPLPELGEGEGSPGRLSALSEYVATSLAQVAATAAAELGAIAKEALIPTAPDEAPSSTEEDSDESGEKLQHRAVASFRFTACEFKKWYEM